MATTTNYAWETPDDTDLVKDGAAAIRTLGSSIDTTTKALNPSTTLGDIEYRSATANTNTRLGIGSSGQVLGVSAGVPAWTTPSQSLTLISNTSFSNVASQAFDGVFSSTYVTYLVYLQSVYGSANNNIRMQLRKAGPTTVAANYFNGAIAAQPNGSTLITNNNNTSYADVSTNFGSSANNGVSAQFTFLDCSGSSAITKVLYQTCSAYTGVSGSGGFFESVADTHTGFILTASAGNLTGAVQIFGVK